MVSFIHINVLARLIVSIANIPLVHYLLNIIIELYISHVNIHGHCYYFRGERVVYE
jgi:hypothetical protein